MRALRLAVPLLVTALTTVAAPARAQWSAPAPLSAPAQSLDFPQLEQDGRGRLTAGWAVRSAGHDAMVVRSRAVGHQWSDPRTLGVELEYAPSWLPRGVGVGANAELAAYGDDRMIALGGTYTVGGRGVVQAWEATGTGRLRSVQRLGFDPWSIGPVAANDRGDAVALWSPQYGRPSGNLRPRVLMASTRVAGHRFARSRRLSPTPPPPPYGGGRGADLSVTDPQIVMAGRTVVIAWARTHRIEARVSSDAGRSFGPVQIVGATGTWNPAISLALSPAGRALVAWYSHPVPPVEGARASQSRGPIEYRMSLAPAGGRFGPSVVLESYEPLGVPGAYEVDQGAGLVHAAFMADDRPIVAWEGVADGRYAVRVAPVGARGAEGVTTYAAPEGDTGVVLDDLATAPDRPAAAVAWHTLGPPPYSPISNPYAALVGAGDAWGPAEQLATATQGRTVRLAFARGGGLLTALWSAQTAAGFVLFTADRPLG